MSLMRCIPGKCTWTDACCSGFSKVIGAAPLKDALLKEDKKEKWDSQRDEKLDSSFCLENRPVNIVNDSEVNGFRPLSEPITIEVNECNLAPFSLPQECFSYVPEPGMVVCSFENGESERMISCNTELSKDELSMLQKLQEEAALQKRAFVPSLSVAAVRYLGDTGDVQEALQRMNETQAWRLSYFSSPISDSSVLDDLSKGFIYFCGRDAALRPALVMRASRVPFGIPAEQFGRLFVFCMEYFLRYMVLPGRVENIVVIVDLKDISYSQMPTVSALMELKEVLTKQDAGRVFCFYVCNMPFIVRALTSVVQAAMTEKQRQKMRFVDVSELVQDFALNQLEEDLGGTRRLETTFFPFPLPPGPFAAGSSEVMEAVPNLHQLITAETARGRLRDVRRSNRANRRLELSEAARAELKGLRALEVDEVERQIKPTSQSSLENQQVNSQCMFLCPFCRVGIHVAR
ncbi:unnamed protein product [Durusdinium trenchii]|uniref:CRAL-TRIO domain-containing protein n=1 Tax=Durusdinium trenchii TaxID=1381693 RepID=A0ABP0LRG8_9DINO